MADGAIFSTALAKQVRDYVRYLAQNGFTIDPGSRGKRNGPPESPTYVRNDSGEEIPPFACLQTTGTVDAGGQNYIKVDKPVDNAGTAGGYLFNGIAPIEIDGYGIAYDGPVVRMLTDGSAVVCGNKWQPDVGEWAVVTGGTLFTAIGDDDIETDVMRAFSTSGGSSSDASIEGILTALEVADASSPYNGLKVATITIHGVSCSMDTDLIGTSVEVVDHSNTQCMFDYEFADMANVWVWADKKIFLSLEAGVEAGTLTPCHWSANNRCCVSADSE